MSEKRPHIVIVGGGFAGAKVTTGLPAWMLWRAYYLSQVPTFGRKVRIFVEWSWGMFFPPDITHFRFTRSHEFVASDKAGVMPGQVPAASAVAA